MFGETETRSLVSDKGNIHFLRNSGFLSSFLHFDIRPAMLLEAHPAMSVRIAKFSASICSRASSLCVINHRHVPSQLGRHLSGGSVSLKVTALFPHLQTPDLTAARSSVRLLLLLLLFLHGSVFCLARVPRGALPGSSGVSLCSSSEALTCCGGRCP